MSRFILAVCDDSPGYVNRFLASLKNTGSLPFEAIGFTSPSALGEYVSGAVVNILLLSRSFGNRTEETELTRIIRHENIKKVVYLGEQQESSDNGDCIYRYQPLHCIVSDICEIWQQYAGTAAAADTHTEIYGVYSLGSVNERIGLVLDTARALSREGNILCMETERFSGLTLREEDMPAGNLSDILYLYKTNPSRMRAAIPGAVRQIAGADVIAGTNAAEDLDELDPSAREDFLGLLACEGGYDALVIGISDSLHCLEHILELCKTIYFPQPAEPDRLTSMRLKEFDLYFARKGRDDILEKLVPADEPGAAQTFVN